MRTHSDASAPMYKMLTKELSHLFSHTQIDKETYTPYKILCENKEHVHDLKGTRRVQTKEQGTSVQIHLKWHWILKEHTCKSQWILFTFSSHKEHTQNLVHIRFTQSTHKEFCAHSVHRKHTQRILYTLFTQRTQRILYTFISHKESFTHPFYTKNLVSIKFTPSSESNARQHKAVNMARR